MTRTELQIITDKIKDVVAINGYRCNLLLAEDNRDGAGFTVTLDISNPSELAPSGEI